MTKGPELLRGKAGRVVLRAMKRGEERPERRAAFPGVRLRT